MISHSDHGAFEGAELARRALNPTKKRTRKSTPRTQEYKRSNTHIVPKSRSEKMTAWLAPQPLRQRPRKAWQPQSLLQIKAPRRLVLRSNLWRTWKISDFPEGESWTESKSEGAKRLIISLPAIDENESWSDSDLDEDSDKAEAISIDSCVMVPPS